MNTLNSIKNYILLLNNELGLSISLHPIGFDPILYSSELRMFNIHTNPYCTHIKTNKKAHQHCIRTQRKVFEKIKDGSFCGVCYAGVKEYIYPVTNGKELKAFISASGYKTNNIKSYHRKLAEEYGFDETVLKKNYAMLDPDNVSKEYIDILIQPLCDMIELLFLKSKESQETENDFSEKVANYIREVRNQKITSADLCRKFNCSRSYLSTSFNNYYNKTIPEYITELRMEDAKDLLCNSKLNITEIAFNVGFSDANYFSSLFKKLNRISPSAYKKAHKK